MKIEAKAYARAGLIGNPSDGYFGKTIGFPVRNFEARAVLEENARLEIIPGWEDRLAFESVAELVEEIHARGYYGGVRLAKATIRRFAAYCAAQDFDLHDRNFSLHYESNVPRGVGLAGSSALITAMLRCLMQFYDVDIPKPLQANLIRSVENEELDISAGLMDRVVQVYETCVFMDFDRGLLESRGYGEYRVMDCSQFPPLFIAYNSALGEGSEVFHNRIRERYEAADPEVVQAMQDFADYAEQAYQLIVSGRGNEIGPLLDQNFDRRRSIYKLPQAYVDMVMACRSVGGHCKFTGSGGAVVGVYDDEDMFRRLEAVYAEMGTTVIKPSIT